MEFRAKSSDGSRDHLARVVLCSFLFTFLASRIMVFLIMTRRIPDLFLRLGGNHIHHLNYGIVMLAAVGGLLLFLRPVGRKLEAAALFYGIGLGLTFDEFGMWLHLGGSYWQRASWDAIAVIAGFLIIFAGLLWKSFNYAERVTLPRLMEIEATAPP